MRNLLNSSKFTKIKNKKVVFLAFLFLILGVLILPLPILANYCKKIECFNSKVSKTSGFPESEELKVVKTDFVPMTAYNSEVGQCDDTPCITANGFNLCRNNIENSVAANFLPLGTRLRIPELYEDRVFVVRDRMNKRYYKKMDIWMINRSDAIKFGHKKNVKIEILES